MNKFFGRKYLAFFVFAILCVISAQVAADTVTYTYDNAGRLTKADYGSGKGITYTYDKAGNITKIVIGPAAPVNMQTAWVDFDYNGVELGTETQPFNTCAEAVSAVKSSGTIIIKTGTSSETITIDKNLNIQSSGGNHHGCRLCQQVRRLPADTLPCSAPAARPGRCVCRQE